MATIHFVTRGLLTVGVTQPQLEAHLNEYKMRANNLAQRYVNLGYAYHRLPDTVRQSAHVGPGGNDICIEAFIVNDNKELPNLIQVFGMLGSALAACQEALAARNWQQIDSKLIQTGNLVVEAEGLVNQLAGIITSMEGRLEYLKQVEWQRQRDGRPQQVRLTSRLRAELVAWQAKLPQLCQPYSEISLALFRKSETDQTVTD